MFPHSFEELDVLQVLGTSLRYSLDTWALSENSKYLQNENATRSDFSKAKSRQTAVKHVWAEQSGRGVLC